MSLYNLLFGSHPLADIALALLGISDKGQVPRFRDAYLTLREEQPVIVIHTRTGGGNRDFYESEEICQEKYPEDWGGQEVPRGPWNADLRQLPGFLSDEDCAPCLSIKGKFILMPN